MFARTQGCTKGTMKGRHPIVIWFLWCYIYSDVYGIYISISIFIYIVLNSIYFQYIHVHIHHGSNQSLFRYHESSIHSMVSVFFILMLGLAHWDLAHLLARFSMASCDLGNWKPSTNRKRKATRWEKFCRKRCHGLIFCRKKGKLGISVWILGHCF